jgi:tetratricopeptide (TPR) repeat protein
MQRAASRLEAPRSGFRAPGLIPAALAAATAIAFLPILGIAVLAAAGLAALTWQQARTWRDTASLWRQAVRSTPDCAICHVNLGHQLLDAGAPEAALQHFRAAVALRPDRAGTYRSLGRALEALGRPDAAMEAYRHGLARSPQALELRVALAAVLVQAGRLDEAVGVVDDAWRFFEPHGLMRYFEAAARHGPEAPVPRLGLVRAWLALGEPERARTELEALRRLRPDLAAIVAGDRSS